VSDHISVQAADEEDRELNQILSGGVEVAASLGAAGIALAGGPIAALGGAALAPAAARALKAAIGPDSLGARAIGRLRLPC